MDSQLKNILKTFKLNEDTISTILGGIVIVVIGLLVFNYFKSVNPTGKITPTAEVAEEITPQPGKVELVEEDGKMIPKGLPTTYTVASGDHLWQIAEDFYNSGYNWTDIAEVNNLTDANKINVGQELTIPKVEVKTPTIALETSKTIEGNKYTVERGDHLWEIAVRSYGDGFAWTKIYEANKALIGRNPSQIEIGQELTLPR